MVVGVKLIPDIKARVWILDSTMRQTIDYFTIEGIFVSKLGDISFQYTEGASEIKEVAATFNMQYFYRSEADPLDPNARI